jgi:hypothetical protein
MFDSTDSLNPTRIYRDGVARETRRVINAIAEGAAAPATPGQDSGEQLIASGASSCIAREIGPRIATIATEATRIMAARVPVEEPVNMEGRATLDIHRLFDQHKKRDNELRNQIELIKTGIRALRNTEDSEGNLLGKYRRQLLSKAAAFGLVEVIYNSANLFFAGYSGGMLGNATTAGVVTLVNLLGGFLFGDVIARHIERPHESTRSKVAVYVLGALVTAAVIVNNGWMAVLQVYGKIIAKEGIAPFLKALHTGQYSHLTEKIELTSSLVGVGSVFIGLVIVFSIARMWVQADSRRLDALQVRLASQKETLVRDRLDFEEAILSVAKSEFAELDALHDAAIELVDQVMDAASKIDRSVAESDTMQRQIVRAHEAASELHRAAVRNSLPGVKLPSWFSQPPNHSDVLVAISSTEAVRAHAEGLRGALVVLADRVAAAKANIQSEIRRTLELLPSLKTLLTPKAPGKNIIPATE